MLSKKITHGMNLSDFGAAMPQVALLDAQQKDYDASVWPRMQNRKFASFSEHYANCEVLYKLTFAEGKLIFFQISANGDFNEEGYKQLAGLTEEVIASAEARGIAAKAKVSPLLAWKELIESPLPDSGNPADRYIAIGTAEWAMAGWSINLNFTWTWPGQLYLEYRETSE
jgi:hypothetical protein